MEKFRRNLSQPGKVCGRDIEEIQYVGMQSHGHTHGLQPEADDSSELVDVTHYRQIIGSLMYLTNSRPDICFAVNTLSQYLVQPRRVYLVAAKHVMRYLKGTIDFGLYYDGRHDYILYGYTDAVGMEVSQTGKSHQVDAFVWGLL